MMMFAYSTLAGIFLISSVKCTLLGTVSIILVKSEVQVLAKVSSEFRLDKKNWGRKSASKPGNSDVHFHSGIPITPKNAEIRNPRLVESIH